MILLQIRLLIPSPMLPLSVLEHPWVWFLCWAENAAGRSWLDQYWTTGHHQCLVTNRYLNLRPRRGMTEMSIWIEITMWRSIPRPLNDMILNRSILDDCIGRPDQSTSRV